VLHFIILKLLCIFNLSKTFLIIKYLVILDLYLFLKMNLIVSITLWILWLSSLYFTLYLLTLTIFYHYPSAFCLLWWTLIPYFKILLLSKTKLPTIIIINMILILLVRYSFWCLRKRWFDWIFVFLRNTN